MLGGSSIRLATIFGIRVGVNVSWFLILFLAIFWLQEPFADELGSESAGFVVAVLTAFGFFGSILLHELGHAVAARREGIEVSGIDLFFFGGMMKMSRDTTTPGQEFRVAVAGPLVTLLIVIVGALISMALLGADDFWDAARLERTGTPSGSHRLIASLGSGQSATLPSLGAGEVFSVQSSGSSGRPAKTPRWT